MWAMARLQYTGGPTPPGSDDSNSGPERPKIDLAAEGYEIEAKLSPYEKVTRWLKLGPGHYRRSLPLVLGMLYESPQSDQGSSRSSSSARSYMAWSVEPYIPKAEQGPEVETMSI